MKKEMLKAIIYLIIFCTLFVGCVNPAANRLSEDCWLFKERLILLNSNFNEREKELFIIEIMQANDYTDGEIVDEIEKIRENIRKKNRNEE